MYPLGHFAIACNLQQGLSRKHLRLVLWPVLVAAVLPDLTDKVFCDLLHWALYGRNYLHNLTAVLAFSFLLWFALADKRIGLSWFVGHLGHLVGDFPFIPWYYPWVSYRWPVEERNIAMGVIDTMKSGLLGLPLSGNALSIWQLDRLAMEAVFLAAALGALTVSGQRLPTRMLLVSLVVWGVIVWQYDLPAFLRQY